MGSVIRKLSGLLDRKQKKKIGGIFLITVAGAFLEVLGVSLMLPLMTAIMEPRILEKNGFLRRFAEGIGIRTHHSFVIACLIFLILIFIVKNSYLMFRYYVQSKFIYHGQFEMQQVLLHSFLKRPYEFFLNAESGEIIRVIQNDVQAVYALLSNLISLFSESIVSLVLAVAVFLIDPVMMLFLIAVLCILIFVLAKIIKPLLRKKGTERQNTGALTYKWLIQSINGIKEIKVTGRGDFFFKNYSEQGRVYINAEMWNSVFSHIPRLLIEMTVMCAVFSFLVIVLVSGRDVKTLIPVLAAFAMAALKLLPGANRIMGAVSAIAFGEPALDKLIENLQQMEEGEGRRKAEGRKKKGALPIEGEIRLSEISYKYPESENYILSEASMEIPVGSSAGIIGKSGAGKTTAADILLGLLSPEKGKVTVGGKDIREHYADWLSNIGYIPQNIFLLDDSIAKNIAFGMKEGEIDRNRVRLALQKAELLDFAESLPEGIETKVGERGIRLSGGQRQRIGIARALYFDPKILVFDEATAALDHETEAAIMRSVNGLRGEKTMFIIAHRLQTIKNCDLLFRVEDRKIHRVEEKGETG